MKINCLISKCLSMKILSLFLSLLIISLIFSCKKEKADPEPNLPDVDAPYTLDAVICKINGEYWLPSGGGGSFGGLLPISSSFYERDSLFSMTFTRDFKDSDAYQWMSFGSFGTLQSGNNIIPNNRIFKDRSL